MRQNMGRIVLRGVGVLIVVVSLAGCRASQEVAEVTVRPDVAQVATIASTEDTGTERAASQLQLTPMPAGYDTVQTQRFDYGKMWTFDNPPLAYFEEAYGFTPDTTWFRKARLAALRFSDNCSASFVSPKGLVMTNHHCAREHITAVSQTGESLLREGFYAAALQDEREVEDLYVDQLLKIRDVTEDVYRGGADEDVPSEVQAQRRQQRVEALERRLTSEVADRDSTLQVEIVELYDGGRYAAYTYKRYNDVRLVMAPELRLGYFGGEVDNFTYPRFNLDMAFFRVYNEEGQPIDSEMHFSWSANGSQAGDAIFVIGNPGSTSRYGAVSSLFFERDHNLPLQLQVLQRRADALETYINAHRDSVQTESISNTFLAISNQIKSTKGQLAGLQDPYLIARRTARERAFQEAIAADSALRAQHSRIIADVERTQQSKEATLRRFGAFSFFGAESVSSRLLTRAMYAYLYDFVRVRNPEAPQLKEYKESAVEIEDLPPEVEEAFIAARLSEMREYLGANDPTVRRILQDQTPQAVARHLVANSVLADSVGVAAALEGFLSSDDPASDVVQAIAPLYFSLSQQMTDLTDREETLNARMARALFEIEGNSIPSDATSTLRISDGVVAGYAYNGTVAPPYTTFYGLYERYTTHGEGTAWTLPEKWLSPPASFDRSTPYNFASTNDTTGGNSGSPVVNKDLEIVGLLFDGNMESLPNEFLYTDERARAVSVDSRGILEALDDIYDADRIALELTTGTMYATEHDADTAAAGGTD